jgi:hypothetical protein
MPVYFAWVDAAGLFWTSDAMSGALKVPSRRWPRILLL